MSVCVCVCVCVLYTGALCADMKDERNWLMRDALPQLHQFAVDNELQLQMVDLRWGASRDMATDPACQPVYVEQINYCRQYSAGPFFAVRVLVLHQHVVIVTVIIVPVSYTHLTLPTKRIV